MVISRIRPALGLDKKTDDQLVVYTGERITNLTVNSGSFPALVPTPAQLQTKKDSLQDLLAIPEPTKAQTQAKKSLRRSLEIMLLDCATSCAEISQGDLDIYMLSGFDFQRKGIAGGPLPAPENFRMELGPGEGQLYAKFTSVKKAHAYEIWYGPKNTDPATWTMFRIATGGRKVLLNELTSGIEYCARCRAIGAQGVYGMWSDIAT